MSHNPAPPPPTEQDFLLAAYDYVLPEAQIAQTPAPQRDHSRLLVLDRREPDLLTHSRFTDLNRFLPPRSLLIANNVQVMPARLPGSRPSGGKAEFLLLTPLAAISHAAETAQNLSAPVQGLARPASRLRLGDSIRFAPGFSFSLEEIGEFGQVQGTLHWSGDLTTLLAAHGRWPLPPYIRRPDTAEDGARYQTAFADPARVGAIAAPTAGLHFTNALRAELGQQGHAWHELTLYVGYGTFSAVRCTDIRKHRMHSELIDIPESTAAAIKKAKAQGRPIVAVGTTSARALEGVHQRCGQLQAFKGETDIFIYPGFKFAVVDHLITNFHLPGSTLLMLTAALAGRETMLDAYAQAVAQGYRFFSYGDAMLII